MIQYAEMHLCVHAINKSIYIQYKYNFTLINQLQYTMNIQLRNNESAIFNKKKARGPYLIKKWVDFLFPFLFSVVINSICFGIFNLFQ